MSDLTAAEASSIVFAVVGVNFLIPKKEIISAAVKLLTLWICIPIIMGLVLIPYLRLPTTAVNEVLHQTIPMTQMTRMTVVL